MKNKPFNYIFWSVLYCFFLGFMGCSDSDLASPGDGGNTGVGGSYARFSIAGDFMYIIDTERIKTFSLTNPASPELIDNQSIGEQIESIFNIGNRLFIGSGIALYLYEINAAGIPEQKGVFSYEIFAFSGCDPVVANDEFAYVTLNTATVISQCNRSVEVAVNQLNIFNITDISNPELLSVYAMENPKGVGLDGTTLFVCDDLAGLKIYDVSAPTDIQLIAHFSDFQAYDVIPLSGLLLVVGPENVYQFDYSDLDNIIKISEIPIEKV